MELLGISKPQALGHLHLLWWWCVDYCPTGSLRSFNDQQLARAAVWSGEPGVFTKALVSAGFLDRSGDVLVVHDWLDFCGELVEKRIGRLSEKRRKTSELRRNVADKSPPTVPDRTQPTKPTGPDQVIKDGTVPPALRAFMSHFTQTLKTKTGQDADAKLVRKAYGRAVAYLKLHPDEQSEVSADLDRAPSGHPPEWYVHYLCGQIEQRQHAHVKQLTARVGIS